jgi:hypothetical protein
MSLQDKMETDMLWIRSNGYTESAPKARTHGYNYIYYNVPNYRERLEMIYRSMGRQCDWEMEKFRVGKKFPDRGNKKRFVKNIFRFMKNPMGYIFWKTYKSNFVRPRSIVIFLGFYIVSSFYMLKAESSANHAKRNYLQAMGRNSEGLPNTGVGLSKPKMYFSPYPFYEIFYYRAVSWMIHINPVWRQGFRKEFQMLNSYKVTV